MSAVYATSACLGTISLNDTHHTVNTKAVSRLSNFFGSRVRYTTCSYLLRSCIHYLGSCLCVCFILVIGYLRVCWFGALFVGLFCQHELLGNTRMLYDVSESLRGRVSLNSGTLPWCVFVKTGTLEVRRRGEKDRMLVIWDYG